MSLTTPNANRLHIGIFGKVNSGKSSFLNAFVGQDVSIVSDVAGTTTDVVIKAMEISPLGACVFIDTAGFDDHTALGTERYEKTRHAAEKCDMAVLMIASSNAKDLTKEKEWESYFQSRKIPIIIVWNEIKGMETSCDFHTVASIFEEKLVRICAKTGEGMDDVKEALARKMPKDFELPLITGDLVHTSDVVMLVMPQDAQAPKGRLILPQVQTIRELLDKECIVISVTPNKMKETLAQLINPPKLIITDSQVFAQVYEMKPKESMLTSFSVLFAAYKGDLPYYIEGAKKIDALQETSKVLIAECCTHAPMTEDIGRVKLPNLLRKRYGENLSVDIVSGTDFPNDLSAYDLIIQCGGCMFNRRYVLSRIERAKIQQVPMTNYGVAIAHLTGILDKITLPIS